MGHTTHHGLNASIDLSKDLVHKDLSKGAVEGICSLSRADASDDDAADSSESGDDWGVSSEDADERGFPKAVQGGGLTSMQCTMYCIILVCFVHHALISSLEALATFWFKGSCCNE
eukprot:scaffold199929_cov21-Tisochrysis_lutea.AAC.5